jgi:hypothetical protein
LPRRRSWVHGAAALHSVVAPADVSLVHPFLATRFVTTMADAGGRFGPVTRTRAMTDLVGDLLPAAVLSRQSKVRFNRTLFGELARDFAHGWTGDGVDHDLVDWRALRDTWLEDVPHAGAMPLLHHVLSTHGK